MYFCGLPYKVTPEYLAAFRERVEAQIGEIATLEVFQYCQIHDVPLQRVEKERQIPENLTNYFNQKEAKPSADSEIQ